MRVAQPFLICFECFWAHFEGETCRLRVIILAGAGAVIVRVRACTSIYYLGTGIFGDGHILG